MTVQEAIETALSLQDAGDLPGAERVFLQILQQVPGEPDALHFLGMLRFAQGRRDEAASLLQQAVQRRPGQPLYHYNLGVVLQALGRIDAAAECHMRAVRCKPDFVEALAQLAAVEKIQGRFIDALAHLQNAVQARPSNPMFRLQLARLLLDLGDAREAESQCNQVLALDRRCADAWLTLGLVRKRLGNLQGAEAACRSALQIRPNFAAASNNLGSVLVAQERWQEAEHAFRRAADDDSKLAEAPFNLGAVLHQQGRLEEAALAYQEALGRRADYPEAMENLAGAMKSLGRKEQAVELFEAAARTKADPSSALYSLANTYAEIGAEEKAIKAFAAANACRPQEWLWKLRADVFCPLIPLNNEQIDRYRERVFETCKDLAQSSRVIDVTALGTSGAEPSFYWPFHGRNDRPLKEAYAAVFADSLAEMLKLRRAGGPKIGVVVTDGNERLFLRSMAGVFERFSLRELTATFIGSARGVRLLQSRFPDRFSFLTMSSDLAQAASQIAEARFDLLYYWEIGTDSFNYFLPFFRLAKVQCTSWGIQVTSGNPQMDYYLSSVLVEPFDAQEHYTEQLMLLDTLLTHQTRRPAPPTRARGDFGFSESDRLYLCAQNLGKFHPDFDATLEQILQRDGSGKLLITAGQAPLAVQRLRARFLQHIPHVADRIVFLPQLAYHDYLALMRMSDVLLDPPHFGGVNTTYDGLSLAKPIVTSPSRYQRGRYTFGCYQKMGMVDCVAGSVEEYVELATRLAADKEYQRHVSERILDAADQIFEDSTTGPELEAAFLRLIERN